MGPGPAAELSPGVADAVEATFRSERPRVLAALIALTHDWDLAQDCAQEAFSRALVRWPVDGIPLRPGAWLTTVARNCVHDLRRRRGSEQAAFGRWATSGGEPPPAEVTDSAFPDERLALLFTCCHPALPLTGQVALTLRYVAGLTTAQTAAAFLVPEATMAKRLARAKSKIAHAAIPFRVPPAHRLGERTAGVLAVLYLLFNQGYASSDGAPLAHEAIRLARATRELLPRDAEVAGLLALMIFQHSRRDARRDASGIDITLPEQDRTRWHHEEIVEGVALLEAGAASPQGPYTVQAHIAACHATAPTSAATDWQAILSWYDTLVRATGSPVVALNRTVAVAEVHGTPAALNALDNVVRAGSLERYELLWVTRAEFRRRLGDLGGARSDLERAISCATSDERRRTLEQALADVVGIEPA